MLVVDTGSVGWISLCCLAIAFWAAVLKTGSKSLSEEGGEACSPPSLTMVSGSGVGGGSRLRTGLGMVSNGPGVRCPFGQHPTGVRCPVIELITGAWKAGAFVGKGVLFRGVLGPVCKLVCGISLGCPSSEWLAGLEG